MSEHGPKHGAGLSPSRRRALAAAMLAVNIFLALAFTRLSDDRHVDFPQFYAAAKLVQAGQVSRLYDPAAYEQLFSSEFRARSSVYFNRPAWQALVLSPFAFLPYRAFVVLVIACNFALLGVLVWKLPQWFPSGMPHIRIWLCGFQPFAHTIGVGQDTLVLTLIIGYGLRLALSKRDAAAGAVLALACFKPHLIWALPLALAAGGRWRALATFSTLAGGLVSLSLLLVGRRGIEQWIALLRAPTTDLYPTWMVNLRVVGLAFGPVVMVGLGVVVVAAFLVILRRKPFPAKFAAALLISPLLSPHAYLQDCSLFAIAALVAPIPAVQYLALTPWPYFWPGFGLAWMRL